MTALKLTICLLALCVASALAVPRFHGFNEEPEVTEPPVDEDVKCEDGVEFIPHHNCSQYYQCDNGNPILSRCSLNTYFSPRTNNCEHPSEVPECQGGTRPTESPTQGTSPQTPKPTDAPTEEPTEAPTDAPTDVPTDAPTDKPTEAPTEVPTEEPEPSTPAPICEFPDRVYNVPVHMNCSAFIRCVYGTPIPSVCADGLLFDPVILKCNLAEEVNCDETTPSTTQSPTEPTTPNPICKNSTAVYQVPYIGNCSLYYLCVEGTPYLEECAPKLLFDVVVSDCVREEDAQCAEEPTQPPTTTTRRPIMCEPEGVYFTEFPGDCSKYVLCANGVPILQSCASSTIFNPNISKCVREEDYICPYDPVPTNSPTNGPTNPPETTTTKFPCPENKFYQHPDGDCALFYQCVNYSYSGTLKCAEDLYFDSEQQGCVLPEDSDCPFANSPHF